MSPRRSAASSPRSRARSAAASVALAAFVLSGCAAPEMHGVDLFPLYRDVATEDGAAGQLAVLWPLTNASWDEEGRRSWSFPFHVRTFTEPERGHAENAAGNTMVPMVPLYWHRFAPREDHLTWFPLYARDRVGARTDKTLLLMLASWSRVDPDGDGGEPDELVRHAVAPLYAFERKGAGSALSLLRAGEIFATGPIVSLVDVDRSGLRYGGDEDQNALSIDVLHAAGKLVQLFHWDDDGSHTDTRFLTVFASEPLSLVQVRTPHEGAPGDDTARTVFAPFWFDLRDGDERFRMLWPLYGASERDGTTVVRRFVPPLVSVTSDDAMDVHGWSFLFGFAGYERDHDTRTMRVLWFPIALD